MTTPDSPADSPAAARPAGTQTLARGLRALELVADSPEGLSIQQVADALGVHRSIATRLLATIAEFRFITRGGDGRYRPGTGLVALSGQAYAALKEQARPVLQELADQLEASVALFAEEALDAVALLVAEPAQAAVRVGYREGARHPLGAGAAGYALLAAGPPRAGESERVTQARTDGYAVSHGEILDGYWGLGVPMPGAAELPNSCLVLISPSREAIDGAIVAMRAAARRLRARLG